MSEENGDVGSASYLGSVSDNAAESLRRKSVEGSVGGEEEAWYMLGVRDEGLNGNPSVSAQVDDASLEVTLSYGCTSKPNDSSCQVGEEDPGLGAACRALGTPNGSTSS